MNRRTFRATLALVFCFGSSLAIADCIHVQHDGVEQFNATAVGPLVAGVVNFTGSCPVTPPAEDPNAYGTLSVTWAGVGTGPTDARHFETMWGKCGPNLPSRGWPGCNGATLKYSDQPTKHLRVRFHMPSNPGTLSHFLKLDSYTTTPGMNVRMAVVPIGADFPTGAATPCYVPVAVNNRPAININPGPVNAYKCTVPHDTDVDILIDAAEVNARGSIGVSLN